MPRDLDELRAIYEDFLRWFDNHNEEVIGGYAGGGMDRVQFKWLQQEIDANRDKICLIFSHHGPHSFLQMGDNVSGDQFKALLRRYENVAAHISGHTHNNYIYAEKGSEGGYWHIATCALIEYPQEWRRITLRDNGDGTGSLICEMHSHEHKEALRLSVIDPFMLQIVGVLGLAPAVRVAQALHLTGEAPLLAAARINDNHFAGRLGVLVDEG